MTPFGYAGRILKIDLSTGTIDYLPTADYADRFIGGRGLAAKLFWDLSPSKVGAFDADNCLICATGPVAGFSGFASSRWLICGKAITGDTEAFSYGNLGGKWGVALKYAGFDALVILGKASKPVYLFIDDGSVTIKKAGHLWGKTTFDSSDILKTDHGPSVSVLTIGPAAENQVPFATLFAEDGASGSGGLGAVMGSKMLKAVVVVGNKKPQAADPEGVRKLAARVKKIAKIAPYDRKIWAVADLSKLHICYGCGVGCGRHVYLGRDGRKYKSFCQATEVYFGPGPKDEGKRTEASLLGTRLCDAYGLDTVVMQSMIEWIASCYKDGLITEKNSDLLLSKIGSVAFIEDLIQKIAYQKGFGQLLARGTIQAAEVIGGSAKERLGYYIATKNNEKKDYDPRIMPMTALLYATEPRRPIQQLHEPLSYLRRWLDWARGEKDASFSSECFRNLAKRRWGSAKAADFTTIEGKAESAVAIQERAYVRESLILCDLSWMMIWSDYFGDNLDLTPLESQIYSAITGNEVDEAGINRIGSRIYNLQRAVQLRQGWPGRQGDRLLDYYHHQPLAKGEIFYNPECIVPGKNGEITDITGKVIAMDDFEAMKSEFYRIRGWDIESGVPTKATLNAFDLNDVADGLAVDKLLK